MNEKYKKNIYVKAVLRHSKFEDFSYKKVRLLENWWNVVTPFKMPEKLIDDLEALLISDIIITDSWEKIKVLSQSSENYYVPKEKLIPVDTLKDVFDRIAQHNKITEDQPFYLLFQDYCVKYMFKWGLRET